MSVVLGDEISEGSLLWRPDVGEVSYNFINFFATCRNASSIPVMKIEVNHVHRKSAFGAVEQIRRVFGDKKGIIFLISP